MDIKTTPQPVEEKTDIQLQNDAINADIKNSIDTEKKLELAERLRQKKLEEERSKELKAPELSVALGGDIKGRIEGKKEIHLIMENGKRPEVTFVGFWNGRLVSSAMNALSRSYRLQKRNQPKTKE